MSRLSFLPLSVALACALGTGARSRRANIRAE